MAIKRVEFKGLKSISEGFARRTIKSRENQTYSLKQVQEDVRELLRTRKFLDATADSYVEENQAVVVFTLAEKPAIATIEIDGNKVFTTEELFKELAFAAGSPLDRFEINRGLDNITRKYKEKGYYYVKVTLDETALEAESRVVYNIVEGPRVRTRRIAFEGRKSFPEPRLKLKTKSKVYFPIFGAGAFDEEQADRDAVELQSFYRNEGFLDARVGYRMDFEDVGRTKLTLVFVIEEGARYAIKEFRLKGNTAFDSDRIRSVIQLKEGDFIRDEALKEDIKRIEDLYGEIGYVDARVTNTFDFVDQPGLIILNLDIDERKRSRFGRITIHGNQKTKDEVVRRELRFYPGEDYNTVKSKEAERRLLDTGLFTKATITPLPDYEGEREAVVKIEEADTVHFIIGFGISTDSGVLGNLTIENRNFDITDWPRTWGEFLRGQAFRGDGQRMKLSFEPGTELTRFRIDFTEPYFLDKPLRLDLSAYLFQRDRGSYKEQRLGFVPALSKRFESGPLKNWAIEGALRAEGVEISNVRDLAARQIEEVKGSSFLTSVKFTVAHDTTDSRIVPSKGHRFTLGWEQVGALGGDYTFGKPIASFVWYKTMKTDIFDRKSVLAIRGDAGYIAGDAPVFERFYAGGFGSIRGFRFRGISPRAGIYNDKVGGDFILLAGGEYSVPLYADNVRGVAFLDMGTVEQEFGINSWRASVGFGLRINLNFFGPVPLVFDFGFPIASQDQDDKQIFNFSFGASF